MPQNAGQRRSLITLLILAAIAGWFIYVLIRPFLEPIFFAAVLAIAASPIHRRLSSEIRSSPLAALVTTLLMLVVVLLPLWALGITIAREARDVYHNLARQSAEDGGWSAWLGQFLDPAIQWLTEKTGVPATSVHQLVVERAQASATEIIARTGSILTNLTTTLGSAVLSLFVMFFLLIEGPAICEGVLAWMPLPRDRTAEMLNAISDSIMANLYGIAAVGTVQGVLVGIGFWIAGLPAPIMWASIAAFSSLVPIVGPAIVWGPGVLVLAMQGLWGKAIFLALWGVFAVGMSDNIVRPLVLSGRTEMNTLVVFFALMGGLQAFGFIGLFVGPVVFSVAITVFRILRDEYLKSSDLVIES